MLTRLILSIYLGLKFLLFNSVVSWDCKENGVPKKLITVYSCLSFQLRFRKEKKRKKKKEKKKRFRKDSLGPGHPNKFRIYLGVDVDLTASGIHNPRF